MQIETWWIWVFLAVVFVVGEMFTAGFFLFWFGIGAAVAALLALLGMGLVFQLLAFIIVSVVMLLVTKRYAESFTGGPSIATGVERLVGRPGIVLEEINNAKGTGRIRVEREEWRADSATGRVMKEGEHVEVLRVEGAHLVVDSFERGG